MKTEAWFGISYPAESSPLSLKKRMLARLVEQLVRMDFRRDEDDKTLIIFTSGAKEIIVKYTTKRDTEDYYSVVEILDGSRNVVLTEKIYESGSPSTSNYHPFCELIDLFRTESIEQVAEIRKIAHLLD